MPSAIASFSATRSREGAPPSSSVCTTSFAPAGFLIRRIEHGLVAGGDPLEAAEGGAEALEAGADLLERRAERLRERRGSERVVDVVEAGEREPQPGRAGGRLEQERGRVQAVELDLRRAHLQLRPRVPARRTAVVAEVADVRRGELVRLPAADAVARVGRMLERRPRVPRIVDPVRDRVRAFPGELAHLRVVAVDDEHRLGRQRRGRGPPALGDVLELAVAVELVAEEVAEQHRPRPDAADDLRQARPRPPRAAPARRRARRAGSRRRPRRGWRRTGSRRASAEARGSPPPSRSSSSCRSSPRRRPRRPAAVLRARRSRPDRASRAASPAGSCRRPCLRSARAWTPRAQRSDSTARRALIRRRAYPCPQIPRSRELPRP